jgi:DNA-binding response OmpR family regulator
MGKAKDIPIIIISGDTSAKDKKNALATGAVGFFPKPIDCAALLATVRATLGENAGNQTPASG